MSIWLHSKLGLASVLAWVCKLWIVSWMGSYSLNIFLMLLLLYPWMGNKVCSFKDVHKLLKPTVWKHCLFIICASKGEIWMTYVRWWMIVNCAMIKSWSYFKVKQLCITAALTAVREWFLLISILLKVLKSKLATRSCQWKELEMIQLYIFFFNIISCLQLQK